MVFDFYRGKYLNNLHILNFVKIPPFHCYLWYCSASSSFQNTKKRKKNKLFLLYQNFRNKNIEI